MNKKLKADGRYPNARFAEVGRYLCTRSEETCATVVHSVCMRIHSGFIEDSSTSVSIAQVRTPVPLWSANWKARC
jgi:hypothetical protein